MKEMKRQETLIDKLNSGVKHDTTDPLSNHQQGRYKYSKKLILAL